MGRLIDKDTLAIRPPTLHIVQVAGWSWYCGYHDTYGIGDTEEEVLFMAGAHMYYFDSIGDDCEIATKYHEPRGGGDNDIVNDHDHM